MSSDEEPIKRLTIDCKESCKRDFKMIQADLSFGDKDKSYGDVLEELVKFYMEHKTAKPRFNV